MISTPSKSKCLTIPLSEATMDVSSPSHELKQAHSLTFKLSASEKYIFFLIFLFHRSLPRLLNPSTGTKSSQIQ
nr:hypothetical protein Itr_chr07CG01730 [Ipomoea trifida]